jgi:hypothetical protein
MAAQQEATQKEDEMTDTAEHHRRIVELERADAVRQALEKAAKRVEELEGGQTYRKAHKAIAALLRRWKGEWA